MNDSIDQSDEAQPRKPALPVAPVLGVVVSSGVLLWLLVASDPGEGGPRLVLVFLTAVFVLLLSCFSLLIQTLGQLLKPGSQRSWYRTLYSATVLSFGAVFLIGLQTLGQLRLIDVVLVILFEIVLNFYILRRF